MLEIMNIQTLLNLILKMSKKLENDQTKLKEIPIIPLKTFKELLPESYIQHV